MLQKNSEQKSSIIYMFLYESECANVENAMKQLKLLHNKLSDGDEILISWKFKMNYPEMLDMDVNELDAFRNFLNSISKT
jgi:hypothetical protein